MASLVFPALIVFMISFALYLRLAAQWRSRSCGRPLPPGPPQLPVIGNLLNIPKIKPWIGFRDLCSKYGDVVHFNVCGQSQVVLGSAVAIREFLEKGTANTSDRLITPKIKLMGLEWNMGFLPYGSKWRSYRRAMWQHFHPGAIDRYRPVQHAVVRTFLRKLLQSPEQFKQHIRFSFSATLLKIGYGIDVEDEENELIRVVDEALEAASQAFVPGRFLIDYLPLLEHVPAWIPGAEFKTSFARWWHANDRLRKMPFVQRNTAFTSKIMPGPTSIADDILSHVSGADGRETQIAEELVQDVIGVTFEAGSDTTFATLQATFVAMALYPDVQRKAQAELDAVVGPNRLPDLDDRDALVYVNALTKEALRWFNVTPLGIPHRTIKDDIVQGYFIPAKTVLIANTWASMHDPAVYEAPDQFRPERFIKDGKLDGDVCNPTDFVFGSGRRICPGRHFADISLFLNVACVLHVFQIGLPLNQKGEEVRIEPQMTDGFLSYLDDCRCTIVPRSKDAEDLINASAC